MSEESPRLLTYAWEGEDLALTIKSSDGAMHEQTLGGPHSSLPFKLHGTIWPYRRSAGEDMMDKDIVFMVNGPEGFIVLTLLCDDALTVYEYVCSRKRPKAEAAFTHAHYFQAA